MTDRNYINTLEKLKNLLTDTIPTSEYARIATIRPTKHFAIDTADNPDMVATIAAREVFVEKELASRMESAPASVNIEELKQEITDAYNADVAKKAFEQQATLKCKLKESGIVVHELVEDRGRLENGKVAPFTDQVFATDLGQGFVDNQGGLHFISAHFKNQQRKGEERLAKSQAQTLDAKVHELTSSDGEKLTFEGGDIRQMPGRELFFIGGGHRSDPNTSKEIAAVSGFSVIPVTLLQEQFYHLDCCFLPLPNDAAVIYEGDYLLDESGNPVLDNNGWPEITPGTATMTPESRALIRMIYPIDKLVTISKAEACAYATNAAILQSSTDGRLKMFVNGDAESCGDETQDIADHARSYTKESLERIYAVTNNMMDIVQFPYDVMHTSGGSVRCCVQEIPCGLDALSPHRRSGNPYFFSDNAAKILDVNAKQSNELANGSLQRSSSMSSLKI